MVIDDQQRGHVHTVAQGQPPVSTANPPSAHLKGTSTVTWIRRAWHYITDRRLV
jgi:hypothetical protein